MTRRTDRVILLASYDVKRVNTYDGANGIKVIELTYRGLFIENSLLILSVHLDEYMAICEYLNTIGDPEAYSHVLYGELCEWMPLEIADFTSKVHLLVPRFQEPIKRALDKYRRVNKLTASL